MKIFLPLILLALAACAPQPTRTSNPANQNAARAFVATEAARHCPKHVALNQGAAYAEAMARINSVLGKEGVAEQRAEMSGSMREPGYCERIRNNIMTRPDVNPFLRAI